MVFEDITRVFSGLADAIIRQTDLTEQQLALQYQSNQLQLQQEPRQQNLALVHNTHFNATTQYMNVLNQLEQRINQPQSSLSAPQQSSLSRPATDPQSSLPAANTKKRPIEPGEGTESPTKKLKADEGTESPTKEPKVDGETLSPAEAMKVIEDQVVLGAITHKIEPREGESLDVYIKRLYPRSEPEKRKEYIGALTHARDQAATMKHIRERINEEKK